MSTENYALYTVALIDIDICALSVYIQLYAPELYSTYKLCITAKQLVAEALLELLPYHDKSGLPAHNMPALSNYQCAFTRVFIYKFARQQATCILTGAVLKWVVFVCSS